MLDCTFSVAAGNSQSSTARLYKQRQKSNSSDRKLSFFFFL